jgi:hypothetical protein
VIVIERHVEKIILAVFVLFLVVAVGRWGISSPLKIEVVTNARGSTENLPPSEADRMLLDAAQAIQSQATSQDPEPFTVPDYRSKLAKLQSEPFRPVALASMAPAARPLTKYAIPDENRPSLDQVTGAMPAPDKPLVRIERELPRREGVAPSDVIAAHVASVYPWQELRKQWMEVLPPTVPPDLIVAVVEAEVRERRYDGTWGPATPANPIRVLQPGPAVGEIPNMADYNGNNAEEIRADIDTLYQAQQEVLEPGYYDILWYGDVYGSWMTHLPDNPVSEKLAKEQEAALASSTALPGARTPGAYSPPAPSRTGLPSGMGGAGLAKMDPSMMMFSKGPMPGGPGFPGVGGRSTARRPRAATPTPQPAVVRTEIEQPKITPVPDLDRQMTDGEVLFWFHDITLSPAKVYQFRIRLAFVNPLVTYPADANNPDDAKPAVVKTPFSEWSNPVSVPKETQFFVTGMSASQGYASVTVFARKWGQYVSRRFNVSEGQAIGESASVRLVNPESQESGREDVDFYTGAVVVRLDFGRKVEERGYARETVEMVYLDEEGQLKSRLENYDKDCDDYNVLKDEADRTRDAAK